MKSYRLTWGFLRLFRPRKQNAKQSFNFLSPFTEQPVDVQGTHESLSEFSTYLGC